MEVQSFFCQVLVVYLTELEKLEEVLSEQVCLRFQIQRDSSSQKQPCS